MTFFTVHATLIERNTKLLQNGFVDFHILTDYGHTMAKSQILCGPNLNPNSTVPKWVLINQPKVPQTPQNLSAQIVCPSPKVWYFDEKRLHWASVVRSLACLAEIDEPLGESLKLAS